MYGMLAIEKHVVANEAAGGSPCGVRPLLPAPPARAGSVSGEEVALAL